MNQIADFCSTFCGNKLDDAWNWFNNLNREEWMVVLALVAVAGFLCMLGMQTRK